MLARPTTLPPQTATHTVHPKVIEEHVGEAAFLWSQRSKAVNRLDFRLIDLARLDQRVEAHLDGLQVAGDAGWSALELALGDERPQDVFAATVWALRAGSRDRVYGALDAAGDELAALDAAVSAFGWASDAQLDVLRELFKDARGAFRYVALGAAAARYIIPPREVLARALGEEEDERARSRAVDLVAKLGLVSYASQLEQLSERGGSSIQLEAARALCTLQARPRALPLLLESARDVATRPAVLAAAARKLAAEPALELVRELRRANLPRHALRVAAASGHGALISEILQLMTLPELARLAGFALSQITGADLVQLKLERETDEPERNANPAAGTDRKLNETSLDDADEDASDTDDPDADAEAYLPEPDAEKVAGWWSGQQKLFTHDTRYLAGRAIDEASARKTLSDGTQPQRRAAAIELSMSVRGTPTYNVAQPGYEQARALLGWT